ncbi:hypothetical protein G5I_05902 [Acromyrmex echinatior]|uniref:Uncharacterized protein n=1 Tax=Acromyrmex echinatior TaxID=103372 RepID=F4WJM1_ACREC|nr:hypothetical protein G5I_05902 [Acromyrmex echinatior]
MYREALWRYLRFIQETRRQKDVRNENENAEDNATDASADNETANDDVFHDLMKMSDIPPAHSISNIVIDIQGFRDVEENFISKEIAVLAINAMITGHWIMTPPHLFGDLPERVRRENNWLTRNYHGIEWFDENVNPKYFTIQLLIHYTPRTLHLAEEQGEEKNHDISRNIEAWRKNIVIEKSAKSEGEQAIDEEIKNLQNSSCQPDLYRPDIDNTNTSVSQTSNFENSITHMTVKESPRGRLWTEPISAWVVMDRVNQNAPFNYLIIHALTSSANQSAPFSNRHASGAGGEVMGICFEQTKLREPISPLVVTQAAASLLVVARVAASPLVLERAPASLLILRAAATLRIEQ